MSIAPEKNLSLWGVSSRTGINKYVSNNRPISLLKLDYKSYTTILKNRMQKALDNNM